MVNENSKKSFIKKMVPNVFKAAVWGVITYVLVGFVCWNSCFLRGHH